MKSKLLKHYRFNVIKDYEGERIIQDKNLSSYFYNFKELPQLLKCSKREQAKLHKYEINKIHMENEKYANRLFKRLKKY